MTVLGCVCGGVVEASLIYYGVAAATPFVVGCVVCVKKHISKKKAANNGGDCTCDCHKEGNEGDEGDEG